MNAVSLKKMLGRRSSLGPVVQQLIDILDSGLAVLDRDGSWLAGARPAPGDGTAPQARQPVTAGGQLVGWVTGTVGSERLAAVAALLGHAATQEAEKRSVAAEALDRYRELNLLYALSGKLAAAPEPAAIAGVALDEAGRLIRARAGLALAVTSGAASRRATTPELCVEPVAAIGHPYRLHPEPCTGSELIRRVLASGQPELVDDVPAGEFFVGQQERISVVCAPIKTDTAVLGALLLVRGRPEAFSAGDLKLLNTVALQAAPAVEIARLHQVAVEKARLEQELQTARQVQAGLLPTQMPRVAGWQFAADWRPALEVAGDYYDVICSEDGRLSLVIADVAGKGMAASLLMVFVRSVLRASMDRSSEPAEGIARANRLLASELPSGMFVTLFYARIDPETGHLTYVNAGHNPPLVYRPALDQVIHLPPSGMAMGVLSDSPYEQRDIRLQPHDTLLLYTDGLTEAFDSNRQQFGEERLIQMLRRDGRSSPAALVRNLELAVGDFSQTIHPSDDLTLLVAKRL